MERRFILLGIGWRGDIDPLIAIGHRLQAAGHEVLLVLPAGFEGHSVLPNTEVVIAPADLTFSLDLPPPSRWSLAAHSRSAADWRRSGTLIERRTRWVYGFLREHYLPGRTVVAARSGLFGARIARETMDLRLATLHHSPASLRSRIDSYRFPVPGGQEFHLRWMREVLWRMADTYIGNVVLPDLNRFRRSLDLPPVRRVFDQWAFSPDLNLGLFPPWFAEPQSDWPHTTRLTGFPLDDLEPTLPLPCEVDKFLAKGAAPIVFTRGSHGDTGGVFFQAARKACAETGFRGILLGHHDGAITDSDDMLHLPFASFRYLLPRVQALVHHGGIGTLALAMQAGTPQVVVPIVGDQWDHGRRVQQMGAGVCLDPKVQKSRLAPVLVDLVQSDATKRRCIEVAQRMSHGNGIQAASSWLETMAHAKQLPGMP